MDLLRYLAKKAALERGRFLKVSLRQISLRDFVIVRELDLEFQRGFTALTGETGAGKSLLLDALQFVLGSRSDISLIREGRGRTEVSAEFDCPGNCQDFLEQAGVTSDPVLLLRRTLDSQGKSRAWINGSSATATQLRQLGELLLDIHGQHAWQSLTRADSIRELLDAYGTVNLRTLSEYWLNWRNAKNRLASAREALEANQQIRDRLIWQIAELKKVSAEPNEWEELNNEHTRLANSYSLVAAAKAALEKLEAEDGGVVSNLARSRNALSDVVRFDQGLNHSCELLESCVVQAQEASRSLNAYLRHIDVDPERYAKLDERLSLWISTARRFRITPNELPATLSQWEEELAKLNETSDLLTLETDERNASKQWFKLADQISAARADAAANLSRAVTTAMQELGMPGGKFEVELERSAEPSSNGLDIVSFLVAAHPGSTPRPIQKIASGGELSRIALAIAVTTSELGVADTLVFDEVDSGVGGAVAEAVGQLLRRLGSDRQVLVVTHLPQVAACANQHFVVSKVSDQNGVQSQVSPVDGKLRVLEIARMLGGEVISDASLTHASEMLHFSDKKLQDKRPRK